jgi:HSP20 family protein
MTLIKYNQNQRPSTYSSFIDRFFNDELFTGKTTASFSPKVDIAETAQSFELQFYLPGLKKEDIKIDLVDDRLTISGERKFENKENQKNFHTVESYFGTFSRSFYLPDNIKADNVEASYQDGILHIEIPKDEKKELKRAINIK